MTSITIRRIMVAALAGCLLGTSTAVAQEFLPPDESAHRGTFFVGLEGFTARLGMDVDDQQAVTGFGLDLGNVGSDRFSGRGDKFMTCPRCETKTLRPGQIKNCVAGRCTECGGIWAEATKRLAPPDQEMDTATAVALGVALGVMLSD